MHIFPLADQFICLDEEQDQLRVANPVAARMWQLSKQAYTASQIADKIVLEFDVPAETAQADAQQFLTNMSNFATAQDELIENYVPITDFHAQRACRPVTQLQYYLPRIRIVVNSELADLPALLDPFFQLSSTLTECMSSINIDVFDDHGRYPIVSDGVTLDTGLDPADAAIKCMREINGLAARLHPTLITFHAAALARGNAGILFPAKGGSGKTTLAAYLMAHGYGFFNDDAVPLLALKRQLMPVPVSLSIKRGSWDVLAPQFPVLSELRTFGQTGYQMKYLAPTDAQVATEPVDCRLLLLPDYSEQHHMASLSVLSTVDSFEYIIASGCIMDRPFDPDKLEALVAWLDGLPCYRLRYSTLESAYVEIEKWFESAEALT